MDARVIVRKHACSQIVHWSPSPQFTVIYMSVYKVFITMVSSPCYMLLLTDMLLCDIFSL